MMQTAKLFSNSRVMFFGGLILIAASGLIWAISGWGGKVPSASADFHDNCNAATAGCFTERWTAVEVLGNSYGFDLRGGGSYAVTHRRKEVDLNIGQCRDQWADLQGFRGKVTIYVVPGSHADRCDGRTGAMLSGEANSGIPVGWTVTGRIIQ